MSRVTLNDVAKFAGVGKSTVSRVLNGGPVSEIAKEKVLNAIQELNYEPDEVARGFKTNKSHTIALMIPTIFHPFFSELAYFVEKELYELNYKLLICNSNGDAEKEFSYISMVKNNTIDGVIGNIFDDIEPFLFSGIPFVSIDRSYELDVPVVCSDHYLGGKIAFDTLYERGCRSIGYIGEFTDYGNTPELRKDGFLDSANAAGLTIEILNMPSNSSDAAKQKAIFDFLSKNKQLDGVFAHNDILAMAVLSLEKKLNLKIPEQLQLVGFDGLKLSSQTGLNISSIRQNIPEIARVSVQLLYNQINKKKIENSNMIPVHYVEGETTIS